MSEFKLKSISRGLNMSTRKSRSELSDSGEDLDATVVGNICWSIFRVILLSNCKPVSKFKKVASFQSCEVRDGLESIVHICLALLYIR